MNEPSRHRPECICVECEKPKFTESTLESDMSDEVSDETLKVAINTLIWSHGRKEMTLEEADSLACAMFDEFRKAEAMVKERIEAPINLS